MPKQYYLTTPIYYVNAAPHIGTALTTLAADVTASYQKMRGAHTHFLTGTDENGIKVQEAALAAGTQPQAFVDEISKHFQEIWTGLGIRYDDFIRTTEPRHVHTVHEFFSILVKNGHIYKGRYEGWYDVSSETYFKEADLVDGKSPDGNEVRWVEEENYFFRLSAFGDRLREHIEQNPSFILPEVRRNEVLGFIRQGLKDACISRANPGWGIPVPGDESQVVYVWFDALINYVSATGWPKAGWEELWPADVEWMGKDILTRFHATLWPAMLMGVGLPLPKTLVGHGWMLMGGAKISKSKGNVVAPLELAAELSETSGCSKEIGIDCVRYYMAATMPYEADSVFTRADFELRYNTDLANDLGNALNRSLAMAHKFVDGKIPGGAVEAEVSEAVQSAVAEFEVAMDAFRIDHAMSATWKLVRFLNKYIDTRAPWALAKSGDGALQAVLRSMVFALRALEGMVRPAMPSAADRIAAQLGLEPTRDWGRIGDDSLLPSGTALGQPEPIFPRIEAKPRVEKEKKMPEIEAPQPAAPVNHEIGIEDFQKVRLRVGRVLEAEPIEGSDKLLRLQVIVEGSQRQIVAGIRQQYTAEDLIGRQVVVVTNLKPVKLRGHESQGMLLAAVDEGGGAILLQPDKAAPEGSVVR